MLDTKKENQINVRTKSLSFSITGRFLGFTLLLVHEHSYKLTRLCELFLLRATPRNLQNTRVITVSTGVIQGNNKDNYTHTEANDNSKREQNTVHKTMQTENM